MTQRVLRGAAATLSTVLLDQNGSAADAAGSVTVGVAKADGTVVIAAGTAATHGATGSGTYSVSLTAAMTTSLNLLTATWTDVTNGVTHTSEHEIVGGFFFSLADARNSDSILTDTSKYLNASILAFRQEVEEECERICDRAFVPRYIREVLNGSGTTDLVLSKNDPRTVRSVRIYTPPGTTSFIDVSTSTLAGLSFDENGTIHRTDFGVFDEGRSNVVIEYEYGLDSPANELVRAGLYRLRTLLNRSISGIPDRATSFQTAEGGTYKLDTADVYSTGIPDIDAVYNRYSARKQGEAKLPASRPMEFDSQRYQLYHGGVR